MDETVKPLFDESNRVKKYTKDELAEYGFSLYSHAIGKIADFRCEDKPGTMRRFFDCGDGLFSFQYSWHPRFSRDESKKQ